MSQQGERPPTEDEWWNRLYGEPESTADTGPGLWAGDTLDDRFASAAGTVTGRPRAWWETSSPPEERPEQPDRSERPQQPDRSERPQQPDRSPAQIPRSGQPEQPPPPRPAVPPQSAPPHRPAVVSPQTAPPHRPAVEQTPAPPPPRSAAAAAPPPPRPATGVVGGGPPTYEAEPTALPPARPDALDELTADTVLDGARYGSYTLRAASVRGDSARYRGEPRRDALLTARFGGGEAALVLVAIASGARAAEGAHLAAADACRWIGTAVGRSHDRLAEDIRAGRRGNLKSGLHRLTDRTLGRLRAHAAERGADPEEYAAVLRCLLLSGDPACRTRVFFGVGGGGLFRLRDGAWQDMEPTPPEPPAAADGATGAGTAEQTPEGDRLTMDLGIPTPPSPYVEPPPPPPAEPFRFRASVARPGDALLLCSAGLAEPLRGEPALIEELAGRWGGGEPPGLAAYLADVQLRVKGYADDRTAAAVWEAR
ncbi:protein phosphatase 2C domain-containing protein [Streptomyces sp. MUM 178J]|uniref:protein phosphatase 2C domain-containing protein n=1 Tax=Streptomyces sp. MUM 178J TaxID=2791991 RepID=UPI001F037CAB|nr:protein phosphatase 2C domain-containing protein [Streptomyces sp. MUM 178J]WRQ80448.1 protein phosphatase 2C domain-containing protein [Streptomyces sp. MUM 178J]